MLEHTKKPPIELKFLGPSENREKAINALRSLGFTDVTDSIPAMELFEDFEEDTLPGVALLGARTKESITQKELSKLTGIPQRHISEMENHKRSIGVKRAKVLGAALNISYKVFFVMGELKISAESILRVAEKMKNRKIEELRIKDSSQIDQQIREAFIRASKRIDALHERMK